MFCVMTIPLVRQRAVSTSLQRIRETWVEFATADITRALGAQRQTTGHMCTLYDMLEVVAA